MGKTQTRPWDPAEHLETEEDMAAYLNVALEEGDLSLILATLGDIARARRMSMVAQETGLAGRACTSLCPPKATRSSRPCSRWLVPWDFGFRPPPRRELVESEQHILRVPRHLSPLVIDDLGYLTQGVDASEVLFTLVAERYERCSQ